MTSDEAREAFDEALDERLSPERREAFEQALARDPELRGEWERYRAVIVAMRAQARRDEPTDFEVDVLPAIQRELRRRSGGRYYRDRFATGGGPGVSLLLVLVAVLLCALVAAWLALHLVSVEHAVAPGVPFDSTVRAASASGQDAAAAGASPSATPDRRRQSVQTTPSGEAGTRYKPAKHIS
ncbi:MAG: hypothetical protein NZ898_05355 [Myxococcota bacterium]|nr:hypothetical protein [Myxococcota bacterium]MDW8362092.1 hypothetical protein [Myxococcales bacterium]